MYSLRNTVLLLCLLFVLFVAGADAAQPDLKSLLFEKKGEKVRVDFCVFAIEDSDQRKLEVYYQVYNSSLEFKRQGDVYEAFYDVEVTVRTRKGRRITGEKQEKSITVSSERRARSRSDFRTSQINFSLDPGNYKVDFTLKDKNSNEVFSKEWAAKLKKGKSKSPRLSKILFAQGAGRLDEKPALFTKGELTVIPSVSHQYGGEKDNRLLFYIEIYPGTNGMKQATVQTKLRRKKGKMVYRDTLTAALDRPIIRQLREISLDEFEPGEYELEVELRSRRGKKFDDKKGTFHIRWSEESLMEHNFDVIVQQLSIISGPGELSPLKEATTLEEKKQALADYWEAKDPYPETPSNEARVEFHRRIRIANENFPYLGRPGWETDRGRVMIRYGYPDQIEDFPFSLDIYPYQEWHYYRSGRYRKFTFVDDSHDGDYRLIYPYDGLGQRPDF